MFYLQFLRNIKVLFYLSELYAHCSRVVGYQDFVQRLLLQHWRHTFPSSSLSVRNYQGPVIYQIGLVSDRLESFRSVKGVRPKVVGPESKRTVSDENSGRPESGKLYGPRVSNAGCPL